jgi:3-oxoacyl-(acyl-carrier-protein) synthase
MTDGSTTPPSPKHQRAEALGDWERRTREWESAAGTSGIKLPEGFDPKNVRVEIGPPMTAEEFSKWRERQKNIQKKFSQ